MPARDYYHDVVKNALIKDGWTITDDPLKLTIGSRSLYIDLGAGKLLAAQKEEQKIAVEIKSFLSASPINNLEEYAAIPYSYGEIEQQVIIDKEENNFFLMNIGWQNKQRIHGCVVHIQLINNKIWIQRDGTEDGITNDLLAAGIPQDKIVLAFHPPSIRPQTEFAVS